jgi:hypothetical protein
MGLAQAGDEIILPACGEGDRDAQRRGGGGPPPAQGFRVDEFGDPVTPAGASARAGVS